MSRASKKPLVRWPSHGVEKPVIGEDVDYGGIDTISYRGTILERMTMEEYILTVGDLTVSIYAAASRVWAKVVEEP